MSKLNSVPQTGLLLCGPGGLRINELLANLPPVSLDQIDLISKAKKYAMDVSLKSILQKPILSNQQFQNKALQRHQALVLMCRVYVGSISFEVKEETIKNVFGPFGAIKSINMSWDPVTMKHKGFAFVEYEIPEAAQLALEHMNGLQLGGRQIKVGRPSNMPQAAPVIQQIQEECKDNNRIYISNVIADFTEHELTNLFEPFGNIRNCKLAMTPDVEQPQHRGYGFIEFHSETAATEALTMDNFDLGGQVLHICRATTPAENLSLYGTLDSGVAQAAAQTSADEDIQMQLERTNDEQADITPAVAPAAPADVQGPASGSLEAKVNGFEAVSNNDNDEKLSTVLVLRHMLSADDEIDDSLHLDVYEECSKHGPISQVVIHVDKKTLNLNSQPDNPDEVKIFVKYNNCFSSKAARQALDGRFFAGRKISADHYDQQKFRLSDYSH